MTITLFNTNRKVFISYLHGATFKFEQVLYNMRDVCRLKLNKDHNCC